MIHPNFSLKTDDFDFSESLGAHNGNFHTLVSNAEQTKCHGGTCQQEPNEGKVLTSRMRMTVFVPLMVDRKGCALKARESSAPSSAASTAPAHVPYKFQILLLCSISCH